MSTPNPSNFSAPPPMPPETGTKKRGCLIAVLVTLLVVLGGCGGSCAWMASNPGKMAAMSLGWQKNAIAKVLAPDVPEDVKAAFVTELDAYTEFLRGLDHAAIKAKGGDAMKLFEPARMLGEAARDKSITTDEAQRFIEMSTAARGASAP